MDAPPEKGFSKHKAEPFLCHSFRTEPIFIHYDMQRPGNAAPYRAVGSECH